MEPSSRVPVTQQQHLPPKKTSKDGTAGKGSGDEARSLCPEDTGAGSVPGLCRHRLSCVAGRMRAGDVSLLSPVQREITGTRDTCHLCWHSHSVTGDASQYQIKAGMCGQLALLLAMGELKQQPGWRGCHSCVAGATTGTDNATLTARGRSVYLGASMNLSSLFWSQRLLWERQ